MKVGGVDLDTQFTHSLSLGLTIVTLTIWMCISFSTAVLLLTAFCFGAGLLSIILDLGHGNQLPNFLSHLKRPTLHKKLKKKPNVSKEEDANIPIEVDEALEQFYERVLQEYIYPWYSLLSYDEDFVQEIRFIFRHATLELWKRLSKVDLTALITRKAIPIGLNHLDALLRSAEYKRQYGHADDPDLHKFLHEYLGPSAHPAALSRLKEVEYCRAIAANLVPFLMPKRYLSSRSVVLLVTDVLQGAILQPVLDLLPDPDHCVNFLIAVAFDPDPSRKFPPPSGKNVRLLENFVSAHQESRQSALKLDLSAILKNQSSLFSFMKFLKEENSLNQLQFCLSVEDFNKRIMTPELNEDEMRLLHKEAMELYDLYFKPNAKHKIDVSQHLAQEIYAILDGPISDVVLLRTTTPLFQAYDEVFGQLESKACPAFHKSGEYFNDLLGCRETDGPDGVDKLNARFWKNWLNNLKRLPFIRTGNTMSGHHSRPHNKSTFYTTVNDLDFAKVDTQEKTIPSSSHSFQIPVIEVPSIHRDKEAAMNNINISRNLALAQIKSDIRSRSTTCLTDLGDSNPNSPSPGAIEKYRRKSHEVLTSNSDLTCESQNSNFLSSPLKRHRRSHSSAGLYRQDATDLYNKKDAEPNNNSSSMIYLEVKASKKNEDGSNLSTKSLNLGDTSDRVTLKTAKSSTFPRLNVGAPHSSTSLVAASHSSNAQFGKQLKKSMSLMSSPVKHLSNLLTHSNVEAKHRSKFDAGAKLSEKIGKGLSKLKHEVLGKSIEGIVDHTVMDSAFDIVDIYDDQSDVTLVSSQRGSGPFSDYRDLSAWRISIPRLATSCYPQNGKPCFVFVVNVQRIDITAQQEDGEDLHWTVHRRYSEFYALEAKLTEFHGEFEDVRLPPKAKFWKGLDVLQGKKQAFEDYLVGLLQKPSLRESDILYTFLTSKEEFTLDGSNLGLGKMIKNVPIKLTKERGQSLQTFIDNFLLQIQSPPPKPRYDSVIGAVAEHDGTTERLVEPHHVFKNNFARQEITVQSRSLAQFFSDRTVYRIASVYDTIVYLLANIFYVTRPTLQLIMGIGALIRQSFDWLVDYAIDTKLTQVLSCMRIAYLCRLLQGALFDSKEKLTESEFAARRERALGNFQTFLRPFVQFVTGQNKFENGTQFVFEALQDPVANKHLALVLIDAVVAEVFPELEL